MDSESTHDEPQLSRREFGARMSTAVGTAALASLLNADASVGGTAAEREVSPPHFAPKAKRIIYLFQSGAPSQMDLFDEKPGLRELQGTELPDSIRQGQRLTGMTATQESFPIAMSRYKFQRYGQSGANISELMPYTAQLVDDLCFVRSMYTEAINHDPAITFFQTGAQLAGRPSMGSWLAYGLGSMNENLPSFITLTSGNMGQPLYDRLWGSGFLPSRYQGVKFQSTGDPVPFLSNPDGIDGSTRERIVSDINSLNRLKLDQTHDPEIATRIAQYELAFRMQTTVPDLVDVSQEPQSTFDLYGEEAKQPGTYAHNCLLARRLAERGVRFIQLFQRGWDHHQHLPMYMSMLAPATDRASAALVLDLKQRGLLEDTLVVWGGEFGRTVYCQGALSIDDYGRDHHPRCFTVWMAGGGIKRGLTYGATDDFSYNITENPVHVHDFHATMLHLLGIDHKRLTYRFQGRDFRLTDVHGTVVHDILA
ncbi:MAG: DUF1501 domain-containing protein [Planctomycetaceae bacterium]|nr:DUF1501 domain-containing protein [Planctomycetaceae bacterium]